MALDPLPRVIFLDLAYTQRSNSAAEIATAVAKAIGVPCMPASFTHPIEYVVQDLLAPLYDQTLMPVESKNLVRQKYHDPIPHSGSLQVTPADIESAIVMAVPMSALASLLRLSIMYTLSPGLFPHDETPSAVIVLDATSYRMALFFASTVVPFPMDHCLAIRIRDSGKGTQIFEELPCRSINMVVDGGITTEELAKFVPDMAVTPPNSRVTT